MSPQKQLRAFMIFILLEIFVVMFLWTWHAAPPAQTYQAKQQLVQKFLISDYCLSTESRHTRHLSSPEWIAPFQDFPGYLEHFPSSSFFQINPYQQKKFWPSPSESHPPSSP